MVMEINKDIERYQESVALGLTARQLLYAAASLIIGAGVVYVLQIYIGLTAAAYVAVPVVAPLALQGFYSYHGMSFMEVMKKKLYFSFRNKAFIYVSKEGEPTIKALIHGYLSHRYQYSSSSVLPGPLLPAEPLLPGK